MRIIISEEQFGKLMEGFVEFPVDYGIDLEVWEDDKKLELEKLVVPHVLRGHGKGSEVMRMVIDYSDKVNKPIYLTPDVSFGGTSVDRLKRFYKKFGFVRNRDFTVKHSMVKYPEKKWDEYSSSHQTL